MPSVTDQRFDHGIQIAMLDFELNDAMVYVLWRTLGHMVILGYGCIFHNYVRARSRIAP